MRIGEKGQASAIYVFVNIPRENNIPKKKNIISMKIGKFVPSVRESMNSRNYEIGKMTEISPFRRKKLAK